MEYTVTKMVTPKAIITIRRPVLTEEEREQRMKAVHDAACAVIIARDRIRRGRNSPERNVCHSERA